MKNIFFVQKKKMLVFHGFFNRIKLLYLCFYSRLFNPFIWRNREFFPIFANIFS